MGSARNYLLRRVLRTSVIVDAPKMDSTGPKPHQIT